MAPRLILAFWILTWTLVAAVAVTQVFVPLIRGTLLFPLFRSRETRLRQAQARARQARLEAEIAAETEALEPPEPPKENPHD